MTDEVTSPVVRRAAPLESPVNFNQIQPLDGARTVDPSQIKDQYNGMSQAEVGDMLERTLSAQQQQFQASLQSLQQQNQQSNQQMTQALAQLGEALGGLRQPASTPAAPDPAQQYALSEADRQELGEGGIQAVDKIVRRIMAESAPAFMQETSSRLSPQLQNMEQLLGQYQEEIKSLKQGQQNSFAADVGSYAAVHGVDVQSIGNDPTWKEFIQQPYNTLTGETYASAIQQATTAKDAVLVGNLFGKFAAFRDANSPETGAPRRSPAAARGSDARAATGASAASDDHAVEQQGKALLERVNRLREQRDRREISGPEFNRQRKAIEEEYTQIAGRHLQLMSRR